MSKEKNPLMQFAGQLESVFTEISQGLKERKISVIETITKLSQPSGKEAIRKIINALAELCVETPKKFNLTFLKLIKENIPVIKKAINKKVLFSLPNLWCDSDFENWVMPEISNTIPVCDLKLSSFELTKGMHDSEIRSEIGEDVLTPDEFASVLSDILAKQPHGEGGDYLNNGYVNIFYIQLKNRVVTVRVVWSSGHRRWNVDAWRLGGVEWFARRRAFSRSSDASVGAG